MKNLPAPPPEIKGNDATAIYLAGADCHRSLWYAYRWVSRTRLWHALPQLFAANNLSARVFFSELRDIIGGFFSSDPASGRGALAIVQKIANQVIESDVPPDKISHTKNCVRCGWCDHADICHSSAPALRNCRTCIHGTLYDFQYLTCERDPLWHVSRNLEQQERGCSWHRFIPQLVGGDVTTVDGDRITYRMRDGSTFVDGAL